VECSNALVATLDTNDFKEFTKKIVTNSQNYKLTSLESDLASLDLCVATQGVYIIRWDFNEVFMFHVFKK
jgi:hypothetical protein